jgi:hypothetical protein
MLFEAGQRSAVEHANMAKTITVGNRQIGHGYPPFTIAEMSGNHNQSLERALEIVEAAAKTGVQAMKIQTYTADTMTLPIREGDFVINDPKVSGAGGPCMTFTRKRTRRGSGTSQFSTVAAS